MSSSAHVENGTLIWISDDVDAFRCVEVVSHNPQCGTISVRPTVAVDDEGTEVLEHELTEEDIPVERFVARVEGGLEVKEADLVGLTELNEPAILYHLRERYKEDKIYTSVGEILVSVNPYKQLPIYGVDRIPLYARARTQAEDKPEPHIYGVAARAFHNVVQEHANQSVLISGESGAGKTEATKFILQYLGAVSAGRGTDDAVGNIQQRLIDANPIMEAFGNAKTSRNNNSSRFGKFIKVLFSRSGQMMGAQISSYLLEKTRICTQASSERNYHVFYQLCKGLDLKQRVEWMLGDPEEYRYLNGGGADACTIDGVDDAADFEKLMGCMNVLGISKEEQDNVFKSLAAILHLGNVTFSRKESGSEVENLEELAIAAQLLDVKPADLAETLCNRTMGSAARSSVYTIPLSLEEAEGCRDALAKILYSTIFEWLIGRLNSNLCTTQHTDEFTFIGVLDIFGFEIFEHNSFEQLCINYTNEKLQQLFNTHIFRLEQEEYMAEGVPWTRIEFNDNQGFIDLLEGRPFGLFSLLSEQCRFPKGSDKSFMQKFRQKHEKHPQFTPSRTQPNMFSLKHYAGTVEYDVHGMLKKNKNELHIDVIRLLKRSDRAWLSLLFESIKTDKASGRRAKTISQLFGVQLGDLMKTLSATQPHFVRCLKPNGMKAPGAFEGYPVLRQLQCAGICECVRIRKEGFPIRFPFEDFVRRFRPISARVAASPSTHDAKAHAWAILAALQHEQHQGDRHVDVASLAHLGSSKIFLRAAQYDALNALLEKRLSGAAKVLQRCWRAHVVREEFLEIRGATVVLQSWMRGRKARRLLHKLKEEERRRREEEERKRREEEERKRREEERKRREEEERKRREEEERKQREKEKERKRKAEERKRMEEEEERIRKEEEEERIRKEEEEERIRKEELERLEEEKRRIENARVQEEEDGKRREREEKATGAMEQEDVGDLDGESLGVVDGKGGDDGEEDDQDDGFWQQGEDDGGHADKPAAGVGDGAAGVESPVREEAKGSRKKKTKKSKKKVVETREGNVDGCGAGAEPLMVGDGSPASTGSGAVRVGRDVGGESSSIDGVGKRGSRAVKGTMRLSTIRRLRGTRRSKRPSQYRSSSSAALLESHDGVPGTIRGGGKSARDKVSASAVFNGLPGGDAEAPPAKMAPSTPAPGAPAFVDHGAPAPTAPIVPKLGFTVYIDGGRFFPGRSSLTAIFGQMYVRAGKKWGKGMRCFSRPEYPLLHPVYKYGQHFVEKAYDPTLTLVLKVLTLDRRDKQQKCVGYALLEVFRDKSGAQPKSSKAKCFLNAGAYQLPLRQIRPGRPVVADAGEGASRVTAASLLVRIVPGEPTAENADMPAYQDATYDSSRCTPPWTPEDDAQARRLLDAPMQTLAHVLSDVCDQENVVKYGGSLVAKWAGHKLNNMQAAKSKTACSAYLPLVE